jgi:hypothetical protein
MTACSLLIQPQRDRASDAGEDSSPDAESEAGPDSDARDADIADTDIEIEAPDADRDVELEADVEVRDSDIADADEEADLDAETDGDEERDADADEPRFCTDVEEGSWSGVIDTTHPEDVGGYRFEYLGVDAGGDPMFRITCLSNGEILADGAVFLEYGEETLDLSDPDMRVRISCGGANETSANLTIYVETR